MDINGVLTGVSVSHAFADVETIADASPAADETPIEELLQAEEVSEAFTLFTCNRAEYYVVTATPAQGRQILEDALPGIAPPVRRTLSHDEAIEHLLRVASGLESQVIGEDEIIGQFQDAYQHADDHGAVGPVIEPVLLKAIHVGQRARTETAINEGVVSLAGAGVECAAKTLDLPTTTAVVVGAGDIGTRAAKALANRDVADLLVANRTPETAQELCANLDAAGAIALADLSDVLAEADLCITATGSDGSVIDGEIVPRRSSLTVIDLGQPPDVAPSVRQRANVAYFDLDRLRQITDRANERRASAAADVERIVEEELRELNRQFKRRQADAVIAAMHRGAEEIKQTQLERARDRLVAGEDPPEAVMEDLADALVSALLAAPTDGLRDAAEDDDWTTIAAAIQIFDPELEDDAVPTEAISEAVPLEDD